MGGAGGKEGEIVVAIKRQTDSTKHKLHVLCRIGLNTDSCRESHYHSGLSNSLELQLGLEFSKSQIQSENRSHSALC